MSIEVMSRVWKYSKAKSGYLLVLLAIADHANDEGTAFPSIDGLAHKARMTRRNVKYALQGLICSGELRIEYRKGPHGKNLFYIMTVDPREEPHCPGQTLPREIGFPPQGNPLPPKVGQSIAPKSSVFKPSVKKKNISPSLRSGETHAHEMSEPETITEAKPTKKPKRGPLSHFFPDDFPQEPTAEFLAWATEKTPEVDVRAEWPCMLNHEFDKPHSDWWRVARKWMHSASQYHTNGNSSRASPKAKQKPMTPEQEEYRRRYILGYEEKMPDE